MKSFKEIIREVFDPFTIMMLISVFVGGLIVFTLIVGDSFLIAIKDSFAITVAMAVFVMFGVYIKQFDKKE